MAPPVPPVTPQPELVAVRLSSSSLTRFCRLADNLSNPARGEWVAMLGPFGTEAGVVVGPRGSVEAGAIGEPGAVVTRRLEPDEIDGAVASVARALGAVAKVSELAAASFADVTVTGLRFTLAGVAVCSYQPNGQDPPSEVDCAVFAERLSAMLGAPARLEREPSGTPVVGTLGRRQTALPDTAALIEDRLSRLGAAPRLGSLVRFPGGLAELAGVDVKHHEARLRLPDGSEVLVPVDELQPA